MWTNKHAHHFIILCFTALLVSAQEKGDSCQLEGNKNGECKLITDCPPALEGIQIGKFPPTCGFEGSVPIVCCENPVVVSRTPGDISQKKCREYGRYAWEMVSTFSLITPEVNQSVCGFKVAPLIIGGVKATSMEFPHMAVLGYRERPNIVWRCGGTLVSEQYVLTAGHCLYARDLGNVRWIRLGDLNLERTDDDAEPVEFGVAQRIRHPDHKPPSQYNDIALLKTDRSVTFNRYIRPACLASAPVSDTKFMATGWGLIERDGQQLSKDLLKVTVNLFSQNECNATYENVISDRTLSSGIKPDSQLCAGGRDEEKDTCQGDSGGPLQIYNTDVYCMYTVVGVTSFGKSCGIKNVPGVYTRVSHYTQWLEDTLWPQ